MSTNSVFMGFHTVNVMSQIAESVTQAREPFVGMPVTKNYYTDRRAATVIKVSGNSITVKENEVQVIDYYAGEYVVLPNEVTGGEQVFTKRKNGRWVAKGQGMVKGLGITLGIHDHYIDPNF